MVLLENCLHWAAEAVGDVTGAALRRFYQHFPEAERAFEAHGRDDRAKLEGQMVETALFCLMTWPEEPFQVVSLLTSSVPHHQGTLNVHVAWYQGLIAAVLDTIASSVPTEAEAELAVCNQIRRELLGAVWAAG